MIIIVIYYICTISMFILMISQYKLRRKYKEMLKISEEIDETMRTALILAEAMANEYRKNPHSEEIKFRLAKYEQHIKQCRKLKIIS